jgi:hypothetical protein
VVPHVTNDGGYPGGLLIPVVTEAKAKPGGKATAPAPAKHTTH